MKPFAKQGTQENAVHPTPPDQCAFKASFKENIAILHVWIFIILLSKIVHYETN